MYSRETRAGKKNRFGSTSIKSGTFNNLQINWNSDKEDFYDRYVMMFFTPSMLDTDEHFHIELKKSEAKRLYRWLGDFLKDNK